MTLLPLRNLSTPSVLELFHPVQSRACLKPFDLCLVESVVELERVRRAVAVLHDCTERLSWTKCFKSLDGDFVVGADLVVV